MLEGATSVERKKWHLKNKTQYHYLDQSSVYEIDSVSDKEEFVMLTASLLSVGINRYFPQDNLVQQSGVWSKI